MTIQTINGLPVKYLIGSNDGVCVKRYTPEEVERDVKAIANISLPVEDIFSGGIYKWSPKELADRTRDIALALIRFADQVERSESIEHFD